MKTIGILTTIIIIITMIIMIVMVVLQFYQNGMIRRGKIPRNSRV